MNRRSFRVPHALRILVFAACGSPSAALANRLHNHLREQDVDTDARIGTDREMGLRFFIFRDPDGNPIQVFQRCAASCD